MEIYKDKGYLENLKYKKFLSLKTEMMGEIGEIGEIGEVKPIDCKYKHKVVKILCPHCNFLCSPQISHCSKCGEPLPKLEKLNEYSGISNISDEDYTEKNIIHSLEKLIDKPIPLREEFNRSSTCYVKGGEEITGLSIFNCGLKVFPHEIFRFKSLKHLALRRNNIARLPKEIGFLSNLEYLDLRLNELETLPNAIGLLLKLKNLNLSSNNLTTIPDSIGDLLTLKRLNLSNDKLRNIPECIENLNCLETLNLKANYWISVPESIEKLKEQGLQIIF